MHKAFDRAAGIAAMVIVQIVVGTMLVLPFKGVFPAMVVLDLLIVFQFLSWRKRCG
jgi:hypothetical protein